MNKDLVAEMIDSWLEERPTRSITALSKLSGMSDSTVRRAQAGTTKPGLDTIIDIGRATGKNELMMKAVEKYYPGCSEVISKGKMAAGNPIESDTSEFFESGMGTVLFVSLFTKKGISRKDTLETYGAKGNEIVNRMIEAGIAKESKSGHLVAEEKWYSHRSPQEVLRVMRNLNVDFDHSLIGSPLARMAVLTESVKMEDAARIQLILDEAIIEVRKIMDESASTGDNVVAVSFLMQAIK